ncbi:MAG: AmmeMemoRadiSam system protein B [Gemmatimonadota bacterium]
MRAVRRPAVAGRFYAATADAVEREVRSLLDPLKPIAHPAAARACIVPHAGYLYSGVTAAHVFARIDLPRLVVILAPNHTGLCHAPGGVSLWEDGAFATPLGEVPVAADLAEAVRAACPLVGADHAAHEQEHAVEVELPFLQVRRNDVAIVPLVLAWDDWERARELGEAIARVVRAWSEPVLLLASSDLNHYESGSVTELKDAQALEAIRALDGAELLRRCRTERISMCGRAPVAATLAAARQLGGTRAEVVDYRHSGWVTGDEARVVGYGGVVIP